MALPNEPITRGEMYLSNIAGQGTALPSEPITREEMYLDAIAKNGGGGGGTGDGDMKKSVYDSDLAVLSAGGIKAYVTGAIADKVDKVQGKGLSTNDYDDTAKGIVDGVNTALDGKISKSETAGIVKNDGTIDTTISGAVSSNTSAISGIKDGTSIDSFSDVETALSGKEDTISDLSTIRSGASAGATAYQKPNDGIPKTDLASAVQTSLSKADSAVQDISGKADKVASAANGNFAGLDSNGNLIDSGKKSSDFATAASVTAIEGKIPSGASSSNKMATASDVATITNGVIANTKLIKDTVGWSGKNKADFKKTVVASTVALTTLTINDNGFTLSGTGQYTSSKTPLSNVEAGKTYKATVNVTAFTSTDARLAIRDSEGLIKQSVNLTGVGKYTVEFTYQNGYYLSVLSSMGTAQNSSITVENIMVYDADILDDTYEPYFDSTAFPRSEQAVLGAANLLDNKAPTATENGITYTVNADKSETISGSATAESRTRIWPNLGSFLDQYKGKTLYLSAGLPSNAPNDYFLNLVQKQGNTDLSSVNVVGGEIPFTVDSRTDNLYIAFIVKNGTNLSTPITIKPQITLAPNTPYAPYAMTNKELTDDRYYHAGDTVNVSLTNFPALLTASSKEIRCTIPLMKSVDKVTGFSFKSTTPIAVRKPSGGYLIDGLMSGYTVSKVSLKENFLCFKLENTDSSAFTGDNNSCLDLAFTGGANDSVITFS